MRLFDDLPPCTDPHEATDHDPDCPRGAEIDRRTEGMGPAERLAALRQGQD